MEIKKGLDIFKHPYKSRGFNITQYNGDNEFDKIRPHLLPYSLHICAADKHIGGIEYVNCTVKSKYNAYVIQLHISVSPSF